MEVKGELWGEKREEEEEKEEVRMSEKDKCFPFNSVNGFFNPFASMWFRGI